MKTKTKRSTKIILAVIGVILIVALVLLLTQKDEASYNQITVKTKDIITYYSFSGNVGAKENRQVAAEQSAKVKEVLVKEGDTVLAGATLAVLDSEELEKQIRQLEANIESNNINIYYSYSQSSKVYEEAKEKLENGTNAEINNAESSVESAKLALDSAEKKYNDASDSVGDQSREQLRQLQSQLESAEITYAGAKDNYLDTLKKYSEEENRTEILTLEQKLSDAKEVLNAKKARLKEVQEDAVQAEAAAKELNQAQEKYDDILEDIYENIYSYRVKAARASMQAAEEARDTLSDQLSDLLDSVNQNLYDLKLSLDNARINYDKAVFYADSVRSGVESQLDSYREAMERDKKLIDNNPSLLELANLKDRLEDCEIKAPMDGVVSTIYLKEGSFVSAGQPAAEIIRTDKLQVTMMVDEYDIFSITPGKEVTVWINALDEEVTGTVVSVSESAQTMNGISYFTAEADIPKKDGIRAGMSAEVKLLNQKSEGAVCIPVSALQFDEENKPYVLFKENGKEIVNHYITLGINDGNYAEVLEGLNEGDTIYVPMNLFNFNPMEMMMG